MNRLILTSAFALGALLSIAPRAFAAELILNGGFQSGGPEVADNWSLTNLAWVPSAGTTSDWTNGLFTTRALNIAGYTGADDSAFQTVSTAGFGSATLTFDFVWEDWDSAGHDFFTVTFGNQTLETFDLGASAGAQLGNLYKTTKSYTLTPYLNGSNQTLTFRATTDTNSSGGTTACSAWVDNVSLQAQPVPEPASFLALGTGLIAILRRTRRRS